VSRSTATTYLQIEADTYNNYGEPRVRNIRVVNATQKRPTKPKPGAVIVRLEIEVPDGAFLPLRPEAKVIVPESMTEQVPVVVEAVEP
jgi:hypothetical protein